jgi:hypothetical protein
LYLNGREFYLKTGAPLKTLGIYLQRFLSCAASIYDLRFLWFQRANSVVGYRARFASIRKTLRKLAGGAGFNSQFVHSFSYVTPDYKSHRGYF